MHPSHYYHQQYQQQQQHGSPHFPAHQQQQQQQRYQQKQQHQPKKQSNLQPLSMKSSPNLAHTDQDERSELEPGGARGLHHQTFSSRPHMGNARSSPNIQTDMMNTSDPSQNLHQKHSARQQQQGPEQRTPDYINITSSTPDLLLTRETGRLPTGAYTSGDVTPTSSLSSQAPLSSSHGLHRYQADYENLSHLSTQPLRSEKISEIPDIDEITGTDSLPTSPDPGRNFSKDPNTSDRGRDKSEGSAPLGGAPTRDPMALKYIKVNQSHEKYPSWPVTQSNIGAASGDQSASINSRAQSMTDHTNTNSEFPKKQRLAYTPGLRPLAERNSPTDDNGKSARNASDPGFKKSEFVYDHMGRVQKRGHDAVEQRFEDFYKNSQPGYPPPAMDSDGHIIGDKEYSAPSPPERDAKAVNERELSQHLTGYMRGADSSQLRSSQEPGRKAGMPTHLNIASQDSDSPRQGVTMTDSGNSPMEVVEPPFAPTGRPLSEEVFVSRPLTHFQSEKHRQSQGQYRDSSNQPNIQRERPSSYTASHSARESGYKLGGPNSKGVIVRSTPYYNTSTQTDMMPYAIKVSDPLVVASRLRNAQVQASDFSLQASPKSPQQQQLEEKTTQSRLATTPKQDSSQQGNKPGSGGNYFNYPSINSMPNNANYMLLTQQSSPFPGIKSIQAKYATDEVQNDADDFSNASSSTNRTVKGPSTLDDHGSIRSAFSDNSASILRKLSEEFYGNRLGGDKQQRISSNSSAAHSSSSSISAIPEHSPRVDSASAAAAAVAQQTGLREAESYSSVVIHHDQTAGLFGRDDFGGSVSSVSGDSMRNDSSNYSDVSGGGGSGKQVIRDAVGPSRSRRSLDPSYFSQKNRLQNQDPRVSSSMASLAGQHNKHYHHQRELSAPVSSTSSLSLSQTSQSVPLSPSPLPGPNKRRPHDLSIISDSSVASNPRSSSSEARSSHSTSFGSNATTSPSATQTGVQSTKEECQGQPSPANMRPFSTSSVTNQDNESLKRLSSRRGSDSVFVVDDDPNDDYEFNRKPSMRKAYGIYDETERLISMSSKSSDKTKNNSSNGGDNVVSSSDPSVPASSFSSRSQRFADGLGLIQEEGMEDNKSGLTGSSGNANRPHKYAWQNEAYLRSRIDLPKGSNLKRTTSEQIATTRAEDQGRVSSSVKLRSSLEADSSTYRNADKNSSHDYENSRLFLSRSSGSGAQHSRTQSEDLTNPTREAELKRLQQQALLNFYQRKTTASTPSPGDQARQFPGSKVAGTTPTSPGVHQVSALSYSPDSSLYESIGGKSSGGGSPTESVAEIISKANENLAKSAQRVDSIRRSNSTARPLSGSSYHGLSAEYMDMAARHERMRKETDWSRLRSSGSLRYSPDSSSTDPRRSNRSSFASENHYEDISMFANSTPRGSVSESVSMIMQVPLLCLYYVSLYFFI